MTLEEGLQVEIVGYRRMTPEQRLQVCFRLYELTRALARQGVNHQHPDWNAALVESEVLPRFRTGAGIP
jgi:hypothetical protein